MTFPAYPEYTESGAEWLGEVPAHWAVDRIKWSTSSCKNGLWGNDPQGDENDFPCVRVADFDRRRMRVVLNEPTLRNVGPSERAGRVLSEGDLVLEKSGGGEKQPVGFVVLYDDSRPAVCSNFTARMELAHGMEPSYWRYLHAAAYSIRLNVPSIKQTSGIQNLDQQSYLDERSVFPPEEEQEAIAQFLDHETARIDALIEEQQRLIELLKEKRQAVISHAVTKGLDPDVPMKDSGVEWLGEVPAHWDITRLKYVTELVVDCPHETPVYDPEGEYCVIRTADIERGVLDPAEMYRLDEGEYQARTRREKLIAGDVVYGREGERWGHAALVPSSDRYCLGQRMMQFRPARNVCPKFLMWQINATHVYRQGETDVVGATTPHVNVPTIRNYRLVFPGFSEQVAIGEYITNRTKAFDKLIEEADAGILFLNERRSALISAAVTGKIDVRGWQPPVSDTESPHHTTSELPA